ncbi:MAG: hypothetical protein LBP79_01295 [Clostridiales bacterium]|jgi:hypothetical protein|nr:hypothetical protein [Clostridiales bacterium]
MSNLEITYKDLAVGAKESFEGAATDKQPFVNLADLKAAPNVLNYGTVGELNNMLLMPRSAAGQKVMPEDKTGLNFGFWSASLSGDDGYFTTPPALTLTSDNLYYQSAGITLTFDKYTGARASELNIKWYKDSAVLSEKTFYPDMPQYFCNNRVYGYNRIEITFLKLNMPRTYLKLFDIEFGVIRVLGSDEVTGTKAIDEISSVMDELPINVFDFTLVGKDNVEYVFQKKQALEVRFKAELKGVYFVDTAKRTARNKYEIQAVDYIGLLDKTTFYGDIYDGDAASELIAKIFEGTNVPYELAADFAGETVTGYLPIMTCREALQQVAVALGAVVDTSGSDKVRIFKLPDTVVHSFGRNEIFQGQNVVEDDKMTEFKLTEHSYTKMDDIITVYEADNNGTGQGILVSFNEPIHNLTADDEANILQKSANHAIINAREGFVLQGKQYKHTTKTITIKDENVLATDLKNVVEISGATLVNKNNSGEVAQRCYNYYKKNLSFNADIVLPQGVKVGDTVNLETAYMGVITGVIESLRYNLGGNKIKAEAMIR